MMLEIRQQLPQDDLAVHQVNALAFECEEEAHLVEAIRASPDAIPELSLVAVINGKIVGHILFSPIVIDTVAGPLPAISLAPLAVLPGYQHRGIGSALVRWGLEACRQLGHRIVIVLGHPKYYPRFGFSTELAKDLGCPYGEVGEAWMALELQPGALTDVRGVVRYPPAFDGV
jgi:putative acetyltransferase